MNSPIWTLQQLGLTSGGKTRLADLSLRIGPGVTAVVGPSGAGKSSLLNLLVGFESPSQGTVTFVPPAVAPQQLPIYWSSAGGGLWPQLTVRQHLAAVCPTGRSEPQRIEEWLDLFDLTDRAEARPETLSQGERSRLAIARALASEARVLVLDEPLGHVSLTRSREYWSRLRQVCQSRSTTLVFASHAADVVLREADAAICLHEGRVTFHGPVEELYSTPPDLQTAESLGVANWIPPEDQPAWLHQSVPRHACLRPEQLRLEPAQDGTHEVVALRPAGSVAELTLREPTSGAERSFVVACPQPLVPVGQRVWLTVLSCLLLTCASWGCDSVSAGHQIQPQSVKHWNLKPEGPRIPAPRAVHAGPEDLLYVLDNAGRVLVYDAHHQLVRQWWMPEYQIGRPEKICVLHDGRIAVADTHYHRVVFFDSQGRVTNTWGQYGHEPGEFVWPVAVVEDPQGCLYVCEYGENDRVQKFSPEGKVLHQFGCPGIKPGEFQRPSGIVWHDGKIYVVDAFNNRVQIFQDSGAYIGVLGGEEAVELNYPYDIVISSQEEFWIVEYGAGRLTKLDKDGHLLGRLGQTGSGPGEMSTPWGVTVNRLGLVTVADTGNHRLVEWQP